MSKDSHDFGRGFARILETLEEEHIKRGQTRQSFEDL